MVRATDYVKKSLERLAADEVPASEVEINPGFVIPALEDLKLGQSRSLDVAMLYVDIRGYSEKTDLARETSMVRILNCFLTEMSRIVGDFNGVVGDIAGDRVMGVFPNPFQEKKPIMDALECALMMQTVIYDAINPFLKDLKYGELNCGIGIDAGPVLVSRLGYRNNSSLVYIGNAANVAAKLEDRAQGGETLITEMVYLNRPDFLNTSPGWSFSERKVLEGVKSYSTLCRYATDNPLPPARPTSLLSDYLNAQFQTSSLGLGALTSPPSPPPLLMGQINPLMYALVDYYNKQKRGLL